MGDNDFLYGRIKILSCILIYIYIYISIREWPYFLGNILVGVRVIFLSDRHLVLSLLNHRGVWAFLNQKKKKGSQTGEAH